MGDSLFRLSDEEWNYMRDAVRDAECQCGMPFYLFDETKARKNADTVRSLTGEKVELAYAMKANPWLTKSMSDSVDFIEVCSKGELEICRKYEVAGEKIVLSGVYKDSHMLRKALNMGVKRFCADSKEQLEEILHAASGQQRLEVLLRVSSGNRFGMEEEEVAECIRVYQKRGSYSGNARIIGIQYYPGTQRNSIQQVQKEIQKLQYWIEFFERQQKYRLEVVEFGLGIGVPYFENEDMDLYVEAMALAAGYARKLSGRYDVIYESGRIIAAASGVYVTKVFARKQKEEKGILFCDGGTNHLTYYGGILGIRTPLAKGVCHCPSGEAGRHMVCGSLCNEGDVMIRDSRSLDKNMGIGDYIIFFNAGAYSATESPNLFLTVEMPAIMVYNQNNGFLEKVRGHFPTYKLI